jgi:PST family polysaccharide transporter
MFVNVTLKLVKDCLNEGYLFFIGKFSTFIFNLGTLFLIGYLFSKGFVAGFDIATKIIFVFIIPFEVMQQAIFPIVVRGIGRKNLQKITFSTFLLSTSISIILYSFSEKMIVLFGGISMLKYTYVLNLVIILIPIVSLTIIVGNCIMVAKGYYKEYNWSIMISAIIFIALLILLRLINQLNFINIIIIRILADSFQLIIRIYYCIKYKII